MNGVTAVYYGKITKHSQSEITNILRREDTEKFKSREGREERIYAWLLLMYALNENSFDEKNIVKNKNGKWESENFFFSISHSNGGAAVAVSNEKVGVDIECLPLKNIPVKALTEQEREIYNGRSDKNRAFAEIWTKKESIFKKYGEKIFLPGKTESFSEDTVTKNVNIGGKEYLISVTGKTADFFSVEEKDDKFYSTKVSVKGT